MQLVPVVADLDPFARMEAEHVVAAEAFDDEPRAAVDLGHARRNGRVVPRPLERRGTLRPAAMDLHAVELVLEPLVAGGGRDEARIRVVGQITGGRGEPRARRLDQRRPARHFVVVRRAGCIAGIRQDSHLPHGLQPRGRVDADRLLDQIGIVQVRDFALPHVEVDEMRPAREHRAVEDIGRRRLVGRVEWQIGLGEERQRRGTGELGETRFPLDRRRAVIFDQQPVHVDAADADRDVAGLGEDLEAARRRRRHHRATRLGRTEDVHRAGLQPPAELGHPLVPVRVELHAALLHDDAEIILPRVEAEAAAIDGHGTSPTRVASGRIKDPGREPYAEVLAQPDLQVRLALRREQRVERAHLRLVVGAAPDLVHRHARELAVRRDAVATAW